MSAMRFSEKEAEMYVTASMTYGLPVNSNFFRSYFDVSSKRARELENFQFNMTKEESLFLKEVSKKAK